MLASSSSRLIDDFDENSDEKHFYSSSLTAETHNYHSTFLDDFCEQTIKDEEFNGEEQIEATSTSHCRTTTVEFDPHLAIIIENELGLNDPQTSRKNAWGNLSYAELIAKAIEHSQDKRLTLSQIYSWMIQYVPYFRDKGDRKSSTGWKNSIRHNLSLHNRFVRIPNEIAGKSSWWTIDPRAKQVRGRRRIQSNENTGKPERRRLNKNISNESNNPLSTSSSFDYLFSNEQQIPTSSSNDVFLTTSTSIRTPNHILHQNNSLMSTPSPTNTLTSSNTATTTNLNSQTSFTSVRDMNKNLYNLLQNHSQDQTYQYASQTHVHHVSHSHQHQHHHHQQQQQQQQQTSQSQQGHHYQLAQQQQQQQQTLNGSNQLTPTILHDMLKSSPICLINSTDNHLTSGMDSAYSSLSKSPSSSSQSPSPSQCDYEFDQMISSKFSKQLKTMDRSSPLFRRMVLAIMRHQMNKSKSTVERKKPTSSNVSTTNSSMPSSSSCPSASSVLFDPLSSNSTSMSLIGSPNIDLDLPSAGQNCSLPNSTFDLDVEAILDFERTTFGDCSFDIHDLPNL